MLVKVLGIGRPNRGAELMLSAIEQQFHSRHPNVTIVTETTTDLFVRLLFLLNRKLRVPLFPYFIIDIPSYIPTPLRRFFRIISDADVDVVLDASGFAYGDQWGPEKLYQRLIYGSSALRSRGQKLFVLPQALGPFTDPKFSDYLHSLVNFAEAVLPRDQDSYNYLNAIVGERSNVFQCPDFTNLVAPEIATQLPGDVAIIANSKMIEMAAVSKSSTYIKVLAQTCNQLFEEGRKPFFLNHEGKSDRAVIDSVVALIARPVDIVEPVDSLQLKSIIGGCDYIISARFHGLASALSQGVPCIAMGWSHKYIKLMEDYGVERFLIPVDVDKVHSSISEMETDRLTVVDQINSRSEYLKNRVSEMWSKVFESIDAR